MQFLKKGKSSIRKHRKRNLSQTPDEIHTVSWYWCTCTCNFGLVALFLDPCMQGNSHPHTPFDTYKISFYLTTQSLCRSGGGDVPFHLSNVGKCNKAFGHLMGTVAYRALVIVGKTEDQGLNINCCIIYNKTTLILKVIPRVLKRYLALLSLRKRWGCL